MQNTANASKSNYHVPEHQLCQQYDQVNDEIVGLGKTFGAHNGH